jgi:hypothetical protein
MKRKEMQFQISNFKFQSSSRGHWWRLLRCARKDVASAKEKTSTRGSLQNEEAQTPWRN